MASAHEHASARMMHHEALLKINVRVQKWELEPRVGCLLSKTHDGDYRLDTNVHLGFHGDGVFKQP